MGEPILRRMFLGFMQVHILHYAARGPVFGLWMISELKKHGYETGPGTLYPLLHQMETAELLTMQTLVVDGKLRKYYMATQKGLNLLDQAKQRASDLMQVINEQPEY